MNYANERYLKKLGRGIRGARVGGGDFLQYVTI
jgi:hypothetical protein